MMLVSVAEIIIVVIVAIMAKPTIGEIILSNACLDVISMYSNKFNVLRPICIIIGSRW